MKIDKKRIFDIIQIGQTGDAESRAFDLFIVTAIITNITVLFLSTFEELSGYSELFAGLELGTVIIFIIEYALRIWTCEYLYPGVGRRKAMRKFLLSYDGIVDLFTILPFFFLYGFSAFRMLRVVRIFHLFRINAYYDSINVITSVLKEKKNQILSSCFIIFVLIMASSLCIYSAEHEAQPEVYRNAFSGIWWSVATIFTVGYGDIYPVTIMGRLMTMVVTLLGVGAVAIPTGIISAGFVERYTEAQRKTTAGSYRESSACLYIDENSGYMGMTIKDIEGERDICVVAVIRRSDVLIPQDNTMIFAGDTVVYMTV